MTSNRLQPLSSTQFKEIYSKVPRLTVEVIVKVGDGVILAKRKERSWNGQWHIPGGTVLYKETLEDALKRIAKEELDVAITVEELVGYIEYPSEEKERGFGWSIGIAFLCKPEGKLDFEALKQEGIELFEELPSELIEEQREVLERVV